MQPALRAPPLGEKCSLQCFCVQTYNSKPTASVRARVWKSWLCWIKFASWQPWIRSPSLAPLLASHPNSTSPQITRSPCECWASWLRVRRSFIVQRRSILVMDEVNLHLVLLGVWCPTRSNKTSATKVSLEARAPTAPTNLSILNSPICTSTVNGLVVLHHASLIFLCGLGSSQCVCIHF